MRGVWFVAAGLRGLWRVACGSWRASQRQRNLGVPYSMDLGLTRFAGSPGDTSLI